MPRPSDEPRRKTPADVRSELERLRTRLEEGHITNAEYATRSARLIYRLRQLESGRRRYALT